jgi:hypothetical protein
MIHKQISACVQKTFQFLDRRKSLLTKSAELFLYFFLQLKIKKKKIYNWNFFSVFKSWKILQYQKKLELFLIDLGITI